MFVTPGSRSGQKRPIILPSNSIADVRLSLTSGSPAPGGAQTAKTSLYLTPYNGNRLALWNGVDWAVGSFTEATASLSGLTSNTNYDVFAYVSTSGAVALELVAWSSSGAGSSSRATALVYKDGVLTKSGDPTRRFVGTIRITNTTGQCEDSTAKRFVWNMHNRRRRSLVRIDGTLSWNYTTATVRQANGSAANQVEAVVGLDEDSLALLLIANMRNSSAGIAVGIGIGVDSTTAYAANQLLYRTEMQAAGVAIGMTAKLDTIPSSGYHYFAWLEYSQASGTTTWFGDTDNALIGGQSGLSGDCWA